MNESIVIGNDVNTLIHCFLTSKHMKIKSLFLFLFGLFLCTINVAEATCIPSSGERSTADFGLQVVSVQKGADLRKVLSGKNTRYIIQNVHDLSRYGETGVTIGENSILDFQGGGFTGGVLRGSQTGIRSEIVKIFGDNITIEGTWNITEAYPEWFGAVKYSNKLRDDSESVDSREAIQKCLNSFYLCILSGVYYIKSYSTVSNYISESKKENLNCGIVLWPNMILRGCDKLTTFYSKDNIALVISSNNTACQIGVAYKYCTKMLNFAVEGNLDHEDFSRKTSGVSSFNESKYYPVTRVWLSGISVSNFYYGIKGYVYLADFSDCQASNTKYGFYLEGLTATTLNRCYALTSALAGIYINNSQYSTLTACCSDRQGRRTSGSANIPVPKDEKQYAGITVINSNTVSLISCGAEGNKRSFYAYNNRNMNIQMHATLHPEIDYNKNYFPKSFCIESSSGNVALDIYSPDSEKHYERYRCIDVTGLNAYTNNGVLNLSVTGRNVNSEIFDVSRNYSAYDLISKQLEYSFNGAEERFFNITDTNNNDFYIVNSEKTVDKIVINVLTNTFLDWKAPHNFIVDFSKSTKLYIKAKTRKIIYIYPTTWICGYKEIVFENILFKVSPSKVGVFGLKDTKVIFKNCVFESVNGDDFTLVNTELSNNYEVEQVP